MEKRYDKISESTDMACEPLGDYGSAALADEGQPEKMLDSDIIGMAMDIALTADRRGELTAVDESFDHIFKKMGWK